MSERLRIGDLVSSGLGDMARAVRATPQLFAFLLLATVGVAYVEQAASDAADLPAAAYSVLLLALSSLVGAAVAVTMHRFIILSETNTLASLAGRRRIVVDFAAVLFGAQYLVLLPSLLVGHVWPSQDSTPVWAVSLAVAVLAIGCLMILRHLLVFPAIAVGAPDRSLRTNAAGFRRIVLPIVVAYVGAMIVIGLVGMLVVTPLMLLGLSKWPVAVAFVRLLIGLVGSATAVAIVSRAYLWREGRWPEAQA